MKNFILFISIFTLSFLVYPMSSRGAGSFADKICSSVTNFLNKESAKADTAVKDCKEKCDWTKKKQKLIAAAQKKANDSCDKGIAPDMAEISKGLDKAAIEKLNKLYNTDGSKMFDGTEELTAKDFNIKSQQAPTLTGKGGQITDLKNSDPKLSVNSSVNNGVPSLGATNQKTTVKTAQTGLTCSEGSCLFGGLTRSQACAEVCCDEYPPPKSWCADLCKKYPSSSRCSDGGISTGNWFTNAVKKVLEVIKKAGDWLKEKAKDILSWTVIKTWPLSKSGLAEGGRAMNPTEQKEARKIFGDKIDYDKVVIKTGYKGSPNGDAFTYDDIIYFRKDTVDMHLFMHEMTHVYQFQKLYGWDYYFRAQEEHKSEGENVYKYDLVEGKSFRQYDIEEQAQIVQDYFRGKDEKGKLLTSEQKEIIKQILQGEGLGVLK